MNSRRRFTSIITAFIPVVLAGGLLFAQDQSSAPYDPGQGAYGQDQGGYPTPPANGQINYPPQQGQQQGYPGQQDPGAQQQQQDPSGRVARVQYMSGDVSIQPGGVNDWIAASQNRPLTTSDRIWTDKNSRAELNVGDGFLRMNSETSVTLTNVADNTVQLELDQGTLEITVRHLEPGEIYEVDTPNYAFTVTKAGNYRFDVFPSEDQSWVTVRKGSGEATGRGAAVRVNSDQQVRFTGGNSLQHTAEGAPARDGFDDWAQIRDKRLEDSQSARYVSPGVIGYQDLDQYGRWQPTPSYGNVWVPYSVPAGWAPYRFGHWVWIAPWGWTWVDDAPWGFAPFHYGRWVYWGGGWAWAPGPVGYWNPYYAPALVGWIGGPGFGVGFGFGSGFSIGINFGWFPLGWGEAYYPRYCGWGYGGWYHGGGYVSNAYFRSVNITNTRITNITNVTNNYHSGNFPSRYGFRNTPGAVTAAPGSAFSSGAAINRVGGAVPTHALNQGTMLRGVNMNPTHASVLGGNAPQTHGVPPASAFNRGVVTANRPAAVNRPANLQAANQATLAHGNLNSLNGSATSGRPQTSAGNTAGRPGAPSANAGRPNEPQSGRANTPAASSGTQARGPATAGTQARVDTTPTSQGGHYVPRPPSAGGVSTPAAHSNTTSTAGSSSASRPATGTSTYGRPSNQGTYGHSNSAPSSSAQTYGNSQHSGAATSTVPRPPQSYEPGHGSTSSSPSHQAAPSHQSAPSSGSHESSHGQSSHGQGAALSTPRSPSYNSAPTYSAANRSTSGYSTGHSSYGASPSYASNRTGSYSSSPYFGNRSYGSSPTSSTRSYGSSPAHSNRSYGSSPSYGTRSYGSTPSYSARSAGSYSAPRSSGGGATYHAPSGGGGGSHASSGGGGGGHHGR